MKRFNILFAFLALILAGCADSTITSALEDDSSQVEVVASKKGNTAYSFGNPLGEAGECTGEYRSKNYELLAGQTNDAGFVNVSTDGTTLFVTYDTNETADLAEVHVNVYTDASDVPTKRPAPGQAPYKAENLNVDSYTVAIPLSDLGVTGDLCGQTFYVIAHAALTGDETGGNENAGETAYSGGNNNLGKGAWFYISEYTVACDCVTACFTEVDMIAGQYNDAGQVTITGDDDNLYVTLITDGTTLLTEAQIYAYASVDDIPTQRPAPGLAPFKVENVLTDTIIVTIPKDQIEGCVLLVHGALNNGETVYAGTFGETDVNVGGRGAWFYYVVADCC